jgi:hypothetical protein
MGGANALGLAKELGSIEVGKCFDACVLDVAGGGVDLFDAGAQFACFTGTKAQILTQKALLDEPRSILEKLLNLGTEHNVSKVWVQGRIVHHKKIVRPTCAARMSVNKEGNGSRECGSSPRKLGTQFTRFTGTKVQTLTQKALLAPDSWEHRPNVPWHFQQGATSPRSRQVGGGAVTKLGEIEARLSEMEGRDNRHIQLPCIASTSSNNACPRVLPTSPRTQASSPSPQTQTSSPSPARAPAPLARKTSGHESVPATPPLNLGLGLGTLTGSLAICRHDDRSESQALQSQALLTPPKAALRLGLVHLHREAILPSPPPALGRSCAQARTHSPTTPPEPESPPGGFEGDDETSSDFEYSFSDTDQDVAYFVGRENMLGAC